MMTLEDVLKQLVAYPSITPKDVGCQDFLISYLESLGFICQRVDNPPVSNFFARFGTKEPLLVFAGHTDVVPVGDEVAWHTKPFELTNRDGLLYGRGTADMKGSLAAMLQCAHAFVSQKPNPKGSLGFLITSGEEGDHFNLGTPYVMAELVKQGILPTYCVVGEPSSTERVGDTIKIGRRGSLTAKLVVHGKQGHVAYPHLAQNPIHLLAPALHELTTTQWDSGNDYFPPTSLQITHINGGGYANNLIPGEANLHLNVRFSTEHTEATLKEGIAACFARHGVPVTLDWQLNGNPFLTEKGELLGEAIRVIEAVTGKAPQLSTSGGTSDGRFIAPYGVEVIELGPVNATIHQANECTSLAQLETLKTLYLELALALLG